MVFIGLAPSWFGSIGLRILNADIEIGHRSTSVALLGNIAMRTGKKLRWDAQKEEFISAPDASALLTRTLRKPWDLIQL